MMEMREARGCCCLVHTIVLQISEAGTSRLEGCPGILVFTRAQAIVRVKTSSPSSFKNNMSVRNSSGETSYQMIV